MEMMPEKISIAKYVLSTRRRSVTMTSIYVKAFPAKWHGFASYRREGKTRGSKDRAALHRSLLAVFSQGALHGSFETHAI